MVQWPHRYPFILLCCILILHFTRMNIQLSAFVHHPPQILLIIDPNSAFRSHLCSSVLYIKLLLFCSTDNKTLAMFISIYSYIRNVTNSTSHAFDRQSGRDYTDSTGGIKVLEIPFPTFPSTSNKDLDSEAIDYFFTVLGSGFSVIIYQINLI